MMRLFGIWLVATALAGCGGKKDSSACTQNSDCPEGARCDTGQKVCFDACTDVGCGAGHYCDTRDQRCKSGAPVVVSFAANPTGTALHGSVALEWEVIGADTLSIDQGVGQVSGTSVAVGPLRTTVYTLTATNAAGITTAQTTVTVTGPPVELTYSWEAPTYFAGITIAPNTPTSNGGDVRTYSVDKTLPHGLTLDSSTGVISGIPTEVVSDEYQVTAVNSSGLAVFTLSIAVVSPSAGLISTGDSHTCALASNGIKCWGYNGWGELGDNHAETYSSVPVLVSGFTTGSYVSAGCNHTCAVVNGAAWCWGDNEDGQLGNGSNTDSGVPVPVSNMSAGVTAIAAGDAQGCAIMNGGAWCWGNNLAGQLGDGTTTPSNIPVQVHGLTSGVQAITVSALGSCAIVNGAAWCWGSNATGALGDGTTTDRHEPVQVTGLTAGVQAISTSGHTCAIVNGGAWCWGMNAEGELGNGSTTQSLVPVMVTGLASGVRAISGILGNSTCAVLNGGVFCWGDNGSGGLGDGTTTDRHQPVQVSGLTSGALAVATQDNSSCAIVNGSVWCWGANGWGELGDGTRTQRLVPVQVSGF